MVSPPCSHYVMQSVLPVCTRTHIHLAMPLHIWKHMRTFVRNEKLIFLKKCFQKQHMELILEQPGPSSLFFIFFLKGKPGYLWKCTSDRSGKQRFYSCQLLALNLRLNATRDVNIHNRGFAHFTITKRSVRCLWRRNIHYAELHHDSYQASKDI